MHEASLHDNNCFLTLTYEDAQLPEHGSLRKRDYTLFMKRLRKHTGLDRVRFYMCGEYGEITGRPHYHACIFGYDFPDKYYWRTTGQQHKCYRSETLERLWPHGSSEIGSVTFESAAYVARYIVSKRTGKNAKEYYGERQPEYNNMSRKPGIGNAWFAKYRTDVQPWDAVVVRGMEMKPPKYYDRLFAKHDPDAWDEIKAQRELDGARRATDNTPQRLEAKHKVAKARAKQLIRTEI